MLTLTIVFFLLGIVLIQNCKDFEVRFWFTLTMTIVIIFVSLGLISNIKDVANAHTLDKKIQMVQAENISIENNVRNSIEVYMNHEKGIFTKLNNEVDIVALTSMYPEIKADKMVQRQISVYLKNNEKIRELKEERIDLDFKRWNIHFGLLEF